jgi:hypothetical protein
MAIRFISRPQLSGAPDLVRRNLRSNSLHCLRVKALNGQAMDFGRKDPAFLHRPAAAAALAASSCGV